mmetsp:Transcript_18515/g.46212  ORF Transcript_18515/g.46212 Transcript_18515/m.46212 type:complete len:158 (+) Transcript_18515:147-620(+)|eukprot:g8210.t1
MPAEKFTVPDNVEKTASIHLDTTIPPLLDACEGPHGKLTKLSSSFENVKKSVAEVLASIEKHPDGADRPKANAMQKRLNSTTKELKAAMRKFDFSTAGKDAPQPKKAGLEGVGEAALAAFGSLAARPEDEQVDDQDEEKSKAMHDTGQRMAASVYFL